MDGRVDVVMLFSMFGGEGSGGENGQHGEGGCSGWGVNERLGTEAAEVRTGSQASGHDFSRGCLFGGGLLGDGTRTEAG